MGGRSALVDNGKGGLSLGFLTVSELRWLEFLGVAAGAEDLILLLYILQMQRVMVEQQQSMKRLIYGAVLHMDLESIVTNGRAPKRKA